MFFQIFSIRVNDRGKYHDQKVQFKLHHDYSQEKMQEVIQIKYSISRSFLTCSPSHDSANGVVHLSAAGVGTFGDITVTERVWLNILYKIGAYNSLPVWNNKFKNKKVA